MAETWIIDILPRRVPKDSPGQYFRIEEYFIRTKKMDMLADKFSDFLLKLNCYYDLRVSFDGENYGDINPKPDQLIQFVFECMKGESLESSYVQIAIEPGLAYLSLSRDDTYMVLCNPGDDLLSLVMEIASSEGLFVWKGEE